MHHPSRLLGEHVAPLIVTFTIVGYPIITALSSFLDLPNRPLSIVIRGLVLAGVLGCIFLIQIKSVQRENKGFWLAWWFFWLAYLSRLFADHFLYPEALQLPAKEYLAFIVGVCILPSLAAVYIHPRKLTLTLLSKMLWVAVAGIALNLHIIFTDSIALESLSNVRAESEILNPITIGHIGATIFLMAIWKLMNERAASFSRQLSYSVAACIAAAAILASGSKGPLLALALSIVFYASLLPKQFLSIKIIFGSTLTVFGGIIFYVLSPDFFLFTRISDGIFNDEIRSKLLLDATDLIARHPVLGAGVEPLGMYPHNLLVESFLLFGIITGLPFVFMVAHTFRKCWRIARRSPKDFWVCLLFTQYFFGAMVSGSLYTSAALYTIMVVVVAIDIRTERLRTASVYKEFAVSTRS